MLFYFHFLYSFPFNVISVATVLCFTGFHSPVVSTLPWFPPSHGFHPVWLLCGLHPPVICIFPWLLVVSLPWFAFLWFTLCHGFHPPMVCIFTWFPPSLWLLCGVPSMVCFFVVYTLPWFPPSHGLHLCMVPTLPVVTLWCPFHGFHPLVVTPWCPFWIFHLN